ncbi:MULTISPECIES: hypothetical protein [unclassified Actinomyces]|uniref:hypothetical protein n=1 Tax=unclassified Actinomyces TaxID=2609248 RepID=UPI00201798C0|nr:MULTISPECIES: hypothetical protein [unclassified Actinomyces]MCL3778436.1 hypothetical protein [Actinomyces sp. AC-20-1]MCL3790003.1 hypothetical protein [Actinomyces sp. 187325]MCL3792546.1 hypothetical protein [Actinomyces sp. 186855]MCL3794579.1 hypothetical protein [Actinomyces sp. 217892]
MALTVGELVAYLRLNDSDFKAKTSSATTTWTRMTSGMAQTAQTAAAALGVTATSASVLTVNVARTGLAYNGLQQNSRAALSSIMRSAEAANAQMDKLDEFARRFPPRQRG